MDNRAQTMSSKFSGFMKKAREAAKQQTERAIEEGTKAFDRASKRFDEAVTNFTNIPSDLGPPPSSHGSLTKAEAEDFTRKVRTLIDMGFSREASVLALQNCHGDLEGAASWIIHPRNKGEIARAERHSKQQQVALLEPGSLARLVRLKSAAEFNGTVVRLLWFEEGDGRWMVEDTKGALKGIRPQNLQLVQPPDRAQQLAAGYGFTTTTTPACSSSCPAASSPSAPAAASPSYQLHSQNHSGAFRPPARGGEKLQDEGSLESLDALTDYELRGKLKELSGSSDLDPALFQALSREELLEAILGLCCQDQTPSDALISQDASSSTSPLPKATTAAPAHVAAAATATASAPVFAPPTAQKANNYTEQAQVQEHAPMVPAPANERGISSRAQAQAPAQAPTPTSTPAAPAAAPAPAPSESEASSLRLKELEQREAELLAAQEKMRLEAADKEAHYKSLEEKCRALESQLEQQAKAREQSAARSLSEAAASMAQEDLEKERAELKRLQVAALAAEQSLEEQRVKLAAAAEERELRLLEEESEKMREIEEAKERLEIQRKSVLMLQRSLSLRSDPVGSQSSSPIKMNKDRGQSMNFVSHSPRERDGEAYENSEDSEEEDGDVDVEDEMWDLDWNSVNQKAAEEARKGSSEREEAIDVAASEASEIEEVKGSVGEDRGEGSVVADAGADNDAGVQEAAQKEGDQGHEPDEEYGTQSSEAAGLEKSLDTVKDAQP